MFAVSRLTELSSPYYARKRQALFLCGLSKFTHSGLEAKKRVSNYKRHVCEGVTTIVYLFKMLDRRQALARVVWLSSLGFSPAAALALLCSCGLIARRRVGRRCGHLEAAAHPHQRCGHGVGRRFSFSGVFIQQDNKLVYGLRISRKDLRTDLQNNWYDTVYIQADRFKSCNQASVSSYTTTTIGDALCLGVGSTDQTREENNE